MTSENDAVNHFYDMITWDNWYLYLGGRGKLVGLWYGGVPLFSPLRDAFLLCMKLFFSEENQ